MPHSSKGGRAVLDANVWMLDELKDEVGTIIAGDTLASLAIDNPKRARSELKSAMRTVFATPKWASRPRESKERPGPRPARYRFRPRSASAPGRG